MQIHVLVLCLPIYLHVHQMMGENSSTELNLPMHHMKYSTSGEQTSLFYFSHFVATQFTVLLSTIHEKIIK
jgi:hypothetical protein